MIYFLLGLIFGFIFSIIAILFGVILSKSGTFKKAILELDKIKKGKGFMVEGGTPLEKRIKDVGKLAEKHGPVKLK